MNKYLKKLLNGGYNKPETEDDEPITLDLSASKIRSRSSSLIRTKKSKKGSSKEKKSDTVDESDNKTISKSNKSNRGKNNKGQLKLLSEEPEEMKSSSNMNRSRSSVKRTITSNQRVPSGGKSSDIVTNNNVSSKKNSKSKQQN